MRKNIKIFCVFILMVISIIIAAYAEFIESRDVLTDDGYHILKEQGDFASLYITAYYNPFLMEREFWHKASISLRGGDKFFFSNVAARIRGRGNSTWERGPEKRPLRFRFEKERSLFSSEYAHRDWILLANHFDMSLMRNHSAFYLSSLLDGIDFTPSSHFVHLYVNRDYMGVYELTDERDVTIGRVQLTFDIDPAVSEYYFEMKGPAKAEHTEQERYFTADSMDYEIRFPREENHLNSHVEYLQNYVVNLGAAIRSNDYNAIAELIDMPSFVDYYLLNELLKTIDISKYSVFMQIRGQGEERRLYFGPVWDFDRSSGNTLYWTNPEDVFAAVHNEWFKDLLATTEIFDIVAVRWNEIKDTAVAQMIDYIKYTAKHYEKNFLRNFERHDILKKEREVYPLIHWLHMLPDKTKDIDTFAGQIEYLVDWLEKRINWLDRFFNKRSNSLNTWWEEFITRRKISNTLIINGKEIEAYSYFIKDNNYFKLRDLAYILNGTEKQFEISYNEETNSIAIIQGQPYTIIGTEMTKIRERPPQLTTSRIYFNGEELEMTVCTVDGSTYFGLRDIGELLNFGIDWGKDNDMIIIDTSKDYVP